LRVRVLSILSCDLEAVHELTVLAHEINVIAPAVLKECTNLVHRILLCPASLAGLLFVSLISLDTMNDNVSNRIRPAKLSGKADKTCNLFLTNGVYRDFTPRKSRQKMWQHSARPASLAEHFEMFHISLGMKKPRGLRPQGVLSGSKAFAAGCQVMTEACTLRTFP
jgi:hypothetical protein